MVSRLERALRPTGSFFHLAVFSGFPNIVDSILTTNPVLLHRRDPVTHFGPATIAVCRDQLRVVEVLRKHGLVIPAEPEKSFDLEQAYYAACYGSASFLGAWLDHHPEHLNLYSMNLLEGAVRWDNVETAKLLVKRRAEVNFELEGDTTPYVTAVRKAYHEENPDSIQILELLIDRAGNYLDKRQERKRALPESRKLLDDLFERRAARHSS